MYYKYPRTLHLPFSPGATSDDKIVESNVLVTSLQDQRIAVTEKMDGECTSLYNNHCHARSIDSGNHPSRDWVKRYHSEIANSIPENWRICGENLFARHSISYDNLDSYFYGFSIWDENNFCLSLDDTLEWFQLLGITHVPIIQRNILISPPEYWFKDLQMIAEDAVFNGSEGIVVRKENCFSFNDFSRSVFKYVRPNHVQTNQHWMHSQIIQNRLK